MMQDFQPSFERFINTINKEQARDLVRSINLFMKNFRHKEVDSESDSKAVQDFLAYMAYTAFPRHPLWAGSSPEDLESAIEGLEKYLLTKLFDRTFGVDALDRERDTAIGLRLQALQFIRPEHLEIAQEFANDAALLLAQKELAKINMFKSPRDKLACILSCCRVISNLLASKKYGAGADDFTPVLIYVTIKAHPDALASNLAFIERFRMSSRLVSEVSYMFVQMQSAVAFVEMLDVRTSLKVDQDELIAHMLAAGAFTDADLAMLQQPESRQESVSALQSQSSEAAAIALVEAAEARAAAAANAASKGAQGANKQPTDLIDFDSGAEPHVQPGHTNSGSFAASTTTEGHTHSASTGQPPQPRNPGHSRGGSQSDAWHGHAPQHSRTPSTTFANLLDSEMPNPLLWNDPFQHHQQQQQQQLNHQQRQHPAQLPPHPYHPYQPPPLPPVPTPTYAPSVPQPHFYAPTAPQQPPVWQSGSVGYSPHAHPPPPPPPPPVPPPPSLPGGSNGTFPYAPAPAFVPPPPPPPPVPPPPPHLPSPLADPSAITRTASIPALQGTMTMVAGSTRSSSAAELEEQGVQLLLAADAAGELQERYPLFHASVDALTLADVKRLLDQYKELVIKYECLARAVEDPRRTAHAQSQHPAPPTTGTSTFRDPAASFFATSTGVPLSLASTAQSTAASAAHPPTPPPPPANSTQQQQQQQQQTQQQLPPPANNTPASNTDHHQQQQQHQHQQTQQQPLQAQSLLTKSQHSSEDPQNAQAQEPPPAGAPPKRKSWDPAPAQEHLSAGSLHKQEAVPEAHKRLSQQKQQQQQHTDGPATPVQPKVQQQEAVPEAHAHHGHHQQQQQQQRAGGTEALVQPEGQQPQPSTTTQNEGKHSTQPQGNPSSEPPTDEHQTTATQKAAQPPEELSPEPPREEHQTAAAPQQAEPSPSPQEDEHAQLAAAQQGAHLQGKKDQTHTQAASTQAQHAAQQTPSAVASEHDIQQQQPSLGSTQVIDAPPAFQAESVQAQQDAAQQAPSTIVSGHSTMQQPFSMGSTQVLNASPFMQTESIQAQDMAQQAPSTVASGHSTQQQPPSLGSTQVIDVPEMEQSLRNEEEEDGMQWRRCALYSCAPQAEKSMTEEGGEAGTRSKGEGELKSMVHGVEDGPLQQQQEKGSRGAVEVQGQDGDLLGGDEQQQRQQLQEKGSQGAEVQGQDADLLEGDVASEQPRPFDSTQESTFAGNSTTDEIISQGVQHWMLGSMTQEGSNEAAGASANNAEQGS